MLDDPQGGRCHRPSHPLGLSTTKSSSQPGRCALQGGTGSEFQLPGIYIQSNNVIVFTEAEIAKLYANVFDVAWRSPAKLRSNALTSTWHRVQSGTHPRSRSALAARVLRPVAG